MLNVDQRDIKRRNSTLFMLARWQSRLVSNRDFEVCVVCATAAGHIHVSDVRDYLFYDLRCDDSMLLSTDVRADVILVAFSLPMTENVT